MTFIKGAKLLQLFYMPNQVLSNSPCRIKGTTDVRTFQVFCVLGSSILRLHKFISNVKP